MRCRRFVYLRICVFVSLEPFCIESAFAEMCVAKVMKWIPRECMLLWIKASAKCMNVKVFYEFFWYTPSVKASIANCFCNLF